MDILTSGADTWLTLNGKPLSFQPDNENEAANVAENRDNLLRISDHAPDGLQVRIANKRIETERYGRGNWQPTEYAGLYQLEVLAPGYPAFIARVRVRPEKFSTDSYLHALIEEEKGLEMEVQRAIQQRPAEGSELELMGLFRANNMGHEVDLRELIMRLIDQGAETVNIDA